MAKLAGRASPAFSFTDPMVSMDLLRAVLQPSINEEIQNVFNKYMKVKALEERGASSASSL